MNINERLNELVTQKGIKQTHISKKTGLSINTVSKILNCSRRILADEFFNICEALEIDPNEFFKNYNDTA